MYKTKKTGKKSKRPAWMRPDVQRLSDPTRKGPIFKDVDRWLRKTWAVFHGTRTTV